MSFFRWMWLTAVLVGVASGQTVLRTPAQGTLVDGHAPYPTPGATGEAVLEEMAGRAAVIFAGTVTAVRVPEDGGIVEVEFAVSDAVRGVAGGTYVVREWGGLWRDGDRYRVGDRRLMLLHAPGPGGLSSPVDGLDGAIPVGASGDADVDLRWLQAKTLRATAGGEVRAQAVEVAAAETRMGLARVMEMLVGWEARRNAGR